METAIDSMAVLEAKARVCVRPAAGFWWIGLSREGAPEALRLPALGRTPCSTELCHQPGERTAARECSRPRSFCDPACSGGFRQGRSVVGGLSRRREVHVGSPRKRRYYRLTERVCQQAGPGWHGDGFGLYLDVRPSGSSRHHLRIRTWVTASNHRRITAPHTRTFNHGAALVSCPTIGVTLFRPPAAWSATAQRGRSARLTSRSAAFAPVQSC